MTEILYYPLIDCDPEGSEKAAMIPTPREDTVRAQAGMWLEEMIPHYFRLCSQNSNRPADTFHIRCPRCGKALKRIGADINETRHVVNAIDSHLFAIISQEVIEVVVIDNCPRADTLDLSLF